MWIKSLFTVAVMAIPQVTIAAETITYTYDAKGRLVRIVSSGSVNNGTIKSYDYDKSDNRQRVLSAGFLR